MRYYIDTCVWIDFMEGESYAEDIFLKIITDESIILVSRLFFNEFVKHRSFSTINMLFLTLQSKGLVEYIAATNIQDNEAKLLSNNRKIPFGDALHAILSRDNDAILFTRDKHFLKLKDICKLELF